MVRFTTLLLTSLAASSDAWVSMNSQSINKSSHKIRDMMKSTASLSAAVAIALGTVIANPNSVSAVDFTGSYAGVSKLNHHLFFLHSHFLIIPTF